jgi:hypothetical protein
LGGTHHGVEIALLMWISATGDPSLAVRSSIAQGENPIRA